MKNLRIPSIKPISIEQNNSCNILILVNINAELPMCSNITISETYLDSILALGYQCITIDFFSTYI